MVFLPYEIRGMVIEELVNNGRRERFRKAKENIAEKMKFPVKKWEGENDFVNYELSWGNYVRIIFERLNNTLTVLDFQQWCNAATTEFKREQYYMSFSNGRKSIVEILNNRDHKESADDGTNW